MTDSMEIPTTNWDFRLLRRARRRRL